MWRSIGQVTSETLFSAGHVTLRPGDVFFVRQEGYDHHTSLKTFLDRKPLWLSEWMLRWGGSMRTLMCGQVLKFSQGG